MYKEILVQSNEEETQVAVIEEGQLVEIYLEPNYSCRSVGSIFKGRVENVLPGMQAAFVNIGQEKNSFLYVEEAIEDNTYGQNGIKPNIRDILKEGQEITVQVVKEPMGKKGARVTRQLTLPGRFLVLMPTVDYIGVSRKITDDEERERLRAIAEEIRPLRMGVIIRTVAEGINKEQLQEDMEMLLKSWYDIEIEINKEGAPRLLHRDLQLVQRILRDLVNDEVKKITFNNFYDKEKVQDLIGEKYELAKNNIFLSNSYDILSPYNIKQELEKALKRKVWLKSGGYLIIDQTEALTSIDVNTGKFVGKHSLEETVLKTNLEAAGEIARQLRLRNIGGIIIIDFIDMEEEEHENQVVLELEEKLKKDKTKAHVLGITSLGLVEMTRKKTGFSLSSILEKPCSCCEGKGRVFSERTICSLLKNDLWELASRTMAQSISIQAHPAVINLLKGSDNNNLKKLQEILEKEIIVTSKDQFPLEKYELYALYT